ncbi:hypothetical protein BJ322DRAFT_1017634 [Thelephora terrestris]|uniref:Uncharacterized protein n=1 Tax=Thelephora terrestris TaxID=56493 RepID=A0A9P6LBN2_9AGAM|nr:hypothetical protein BJ322DRAFT_1017634 [Thelephora terrestris]
MLLMLWETLEKCLKFQPNERPCIEDVRQRLEESSDSPLPPFPELDKEMNPHGGDSHSTNSLSDDLNPKSDVGMTEGAAASPGLDHLTSRQERKQHVDSVGREVTKPDSQTPPIDSRISVIDPHTTVELAKVAGQSGSNMRTPDFYRGSETTRLDGIAERENEIQEDGAGHENLSVHGAHLPTLRGKYRETRLKASRGVCPTAERIYQRLARIIERHAPNPQEERLDQRFVKILEEHASNPQERLYCQGTSIRDGEVPQKILFAMDDGPCFPAELALAGRCDLLVDGDSAVFTEQNQTINLRIEWPGYDGWGAQIRVVSYQEKPRSISRAKLVTEIAKQLVKFIEAKESVEIYPVHETFRVGPGGIELRHIGIASLEQVTRGSWQPVLVYNGLELEEI